MKKLSKDLSIIIPCHNEEPFIISCLQSVINNDFSKSKIELFVVDGMSEDGTREKVKAFAKKHRFIKLLDNPRKITPHALNLGLARARGRIIMRMDAHSTYGKKYISKCLKGLARYKADNVGGLWKIKPRENNFLGRAIVKALSHRFGIGNAHYRLASSKKPLWVDTVPYFCCTRKILEKVGRFNEKLARGQDMEFSLRLRRAGGRTLLLPSISSTYYARSTFSLFLRHNWTNGRWAILPFIHSDIVPVSLRHLIPLMFVLAILAMVPMVLMWPALMPLAALGLGLYAMASLVSSVQVAWQRRDPKYAAVLPFVFAGLHIPYGMGSLWGIFEVAVIAIRRMVEPEKNPKTA